MSTAPASWPMLVTGKLDERDGGVQVTLALDETGDPDDTEAEEL